MGRLRTWWEYGFGAHVVRRWTVDVWREARGKAPRD